MQVFGVVELKLEFEVPSCVSSLLRLAAEVLQSLEEASNEHGIGIRALLLVLGIEIEQSQNGVVAAVPSDTLHKLALGLGVLHVGFSIL